MNWHTFQMQFPDKAANYPGGEQAFTQQYIDRANQWSQQGGGPRGPRQNALPHQGGQNPYELAQGGGGLSQHPLIALGLGGYQGGQGGVQTNPPVLASSNPNIQQPPQGGWPPRNIQDILGGGPRNWPPRPKVPDWQGVGEQITGFGETLGGYGEQLGGFGEQLGGYEEQLGGLGEQIGGYKEQMGGFGEQLGGFKGQFENIDSRLQNMEQGISGLTDKLGVQQQQQNPFQGISSFGFGGYNPFYGGYSHFRGGGPVKKPSLFQKLFDYGKNVASMQLGGGVTGAGTGTSDSIPARLSHGEWIHSAKAVLGKGNGSMEEGFKVLGKEMKEAEKKADSFAV